MNILSWLIYLADICNNLDWVFSCLFWVSTIAGIICFLVCWAMITASDDKDAPDAADWKMWRRATFWTMLTFVLSIILGAVVPSKETVYAIAASEMGERALATPTADKAFKALDAWLDKQITPEPEVKTEKTPAK